LIHKILRKMVVEVISALTEKLVTLEKKMDSYGGELSQVQTKVDLAMQSISLV
jgi:DNA anti-recombination protein RmuC